ncbi:MAG: hypothetical protein HC831_26890 [Chloroflexia bacterium]|nr:hypothetical protein [Chloroflexia bacterium]
MVEQRPFEKLVIRGDKTYTKSSLSEFEREIQEDLKEIEDIQRKIINNDYNH